MLEGYDLGTEDKAVQALREILQEAALLGLWRARFFEHAAFYGGTALRILHGLDRYSEDMDFTLTRPIPDFSLSPYLLALTNELESLGFSVTARMKEKSRFSTVQSGFLKAGTKMHLLSISVNRRIVDAIDPNRLVKIRIEIDTSPPGYFETETRFLFRPIPFAVRTCALPDLFAGKMHAVLCRNWKNRVKGRDWYDMVWFAANHPTLHLRHLEERMRQSGHWSGRNHISKKTFNGLLQERILTVDIEKAKAEVRPYLRETDAIAAWSREFFHDVAKRIGIS
jgi:predicted nucleotidyltransferase component of viral defense system